MLLLVPGFDKISDKFNEGKSKLTLIWVYFLNLSFTGVNDCPLSWFLERWPCIAWDSEDLTSHCIPTRWSVVAAQAQVFRWGDLSIPVPRQLRWINPALIGGFPNYPCYLWQPFLYPLRDCTNSGWSVLNTRPVILVPLNPGYQAVSFPSNVHSLDSPVTPRQDQ